MNTCDFSIVIPWHRGLDQLRRSVLSVRRQTHAASEIIIVCNGPALGQMDVVRREFQGGKIKVIGLPEANANAARNAGIRAATARYCAFLDCDDEYLPAMLAQAAVHLAQFPHGIVSTAGLRKRASGACWRFPRRSMRAQEDVASFFMAGGNFLLTSSLAMQAATALDLLFDPDIDKFQDLDFLMRAEKRGYRIDILLQPGFIYHDEENEGRLSHDIDFSRHAAWVSRNRLLTPQARAAFLARAVAQHELPGNLCLNLLRMWQGYRIGGIPLPQSLAMTARHLLPHRLKGPLLEFFLTHLRR
ncbi:glycosyltransferase [Rhizobium sp. LjRoot30]